MVEEVVEVVEVVMVVEVVVYWRVPCPHLGYTGERAVAGSVVEY